MTAALLGGGPGGEATKEGEEEKPMSDVQALVQQVANMSEEKQRELMQAMLQVCREKVVPIKKEEQPHGVKREWPSTPVKTELKMNKQLRLSALWSDCSKGSNESLDSVESLAEMQMKRRHQLQMKFLMAILWRTSESGADVEGR